MRKIEARPQKPLRQGGDEVDRAGKDPIPQEALCDPVVSAAIDLPCLHCTCIHVDFLLAREY
jgi:hypothetical protein